ncbi:MAG: glutamate 5-kinase [Chloroflexi bacterium]|nr:glutamate 5-kinase [Chloroflexota bacterium]
MQRKPKANSAAASIEDGALAYRRIVVKAGTSLLTRNSDRLNLEVMAALVGQVARLHLRGAEVLLVSSGAVAAGRSVLKVARNGAKLPMQQVLAAVGQGRLMHSYEQLFGWHDIPIAQALLTRRDIADPMSCLNIRNTMLELLEQRVIPIINENDVVAVEELAGDAFGDNDTLSAMVSELVNADLLVMLGQVRGLFDKDPNLDASAQLIPVVEDVERVRALGGPSWNNAGRGGMATKLQAAETLMRQGTDVVIASGLEHDVLTRLACGERIGTLFPSTGIKLEHRKQEMLRRRPTRGEIAVDAGAANALRHRKSLLPVGVRRIFGVFERGDAISILDSNRVEIGRGIANYGSSELEKIKGCHSDRINELLGYDYGDEAVHINNMVVL